MIFDLMAFKIHLRSKNDELFIQTFLLKAHEMIFCEMLLKSSVVDVVFLLAMGGLSITDMAAFVFLTAVDIEFVASIKSLTTESTLWMSFEAGLIQRCRLIIT